MRKLLILCGALLCFSLTAAAQDSTAAFDASSPASEPAAPQLFTPPDREAWQLGDGFQYQHYNVLGQNFHTFGYNVGLTRYINNWFGIEGVGSFGFGNTGTSPSLVAKSMFVGGGPHLAFNNSSRLEPWIHVIPGWQHFRFTQTDKIGSNSAIAFMGGGGVDYKLGDSVYWRFQADFIGSHFQSTIDKNYSFGTGLILNF
jgi:opacity protein-like surface antigen